MSVPEPNSPEARRAAQKVRNVFYFIALANIVLIAIVMWPTPKPPVPLGSASKTEEKVPATSDFQVPSRDQTPMQEMEAVNDRIIAAYRERDAERFAQEFSLQAIPPVDEDYFRKVIVGLYHEEFGDITGKKLTGETSADADYGMLVYEITCTKRDRAKISTNFRRESGVLKAVQWRMEKL